MLCTDDAGWQARVCSSQVSVLPRLAVQVITFGLHMVVLLFLFIAFQACGPTESELKQQAKEVRIRDARALLSAMATRHKASRDWDKSIKDKLFPFSLDVQDAISAMNGQPFVVFGMLHDIHSAGGRKYVTLDYQSSAADVVFVLEVQESLLRSINSQENSRYNMFAFVVSASGSSVPLLKARIEEGGEEVVIDASDVVVVKGQLKDFLRLDGMTLEELVPS